MSHPVAPPAGAPARRPGWLLRGATLAARVARPLLGEERALRSVGRVYAVATLLYSTIVAQYGRALLGIVWALLTPLLFIAVYVPVLANMNGLKDVFPEYLGVGPLGLPLYVVSGFLLWTSVSAGLTGGASSLTDNQDVVHHSPIPLVILPLVKVLNGAVSWVLSCALMAAVLAGLQLAGFDAERGAEFWPGWRLLLFPVITVLMVVFALGVALFCSALAVLFRDVLQILNTLLLVEFFAAPVLYLPEQFQDQGLFQLQITLNPLTPLLNLTHAMFLPSYPFAWSDVGIACVWAVGAYAVGLFTFKRLEAGLADYT